VFGASGVQSTKFHTSCSQDIALGDVYGSVIVVGFTDEDGDGADLTPPNIGPGLGDDSANSGPGPEGNPGETVVFTYIVSDIAGDIIDVVLTASDTLNGDYSPELVEVSSGKRIYVYSFVIPTLSSGQYPLEVKGSSQAAATIDGPGCEAQAQAFFTIDKEPFRGDICETCGKPVAFKFLFVPGSTDFTASDSKAELTTFSVPTGTSRIVLSEKEGGEGDVFFDGDVEVGGEFMASGDFGSATFISAFAGPGSNQVIQIMEYHTSCSGTIRLGDILGSIEVIEYTGEDCVLS